MKKDFKERYDFDVSSCVSYDVKRKIYELAEKEEVTVSTMVRLLIEEGLENYER